MSFGGDYPVGAANHPDAPWNKQDKIYVEPHCPICGGYDVVKQREDINFKIDEEDIDDLLAECKENDICRDCNCEFTEGDYIDI